jgi:predicted nucleotidyltransferase
MTRDSILQSLRANREELGSRFAVERLGIFGSAARDELVDQSDLDVLVAFKGRSTYAAYLGLKRHLEQLVGLRVDLVTEAGLKPRARESIERDLIRVT